MPAANSMKAFNFQAWIDEHRDLLKPPVNNKLIWTDGDLMAFVVGGPNVRTDYHDDPVDEFFYQIEGDMILRVMEEPGSPPVDIPIREGEVFFLPAHTRHSPQRPEAGSIGLVIEPARPPGEKDGFDWYCPNCHQLVYRAEVILESIVTDLPPLFAAFYGDEEKRTCGSCGHLHPSRDG
ncbi:MAG: 3-hydroxyanthranilate 3,4-dioxygenase [Actinobacteria bacterium]|jgi:3-hydroxyanthranilate 3,4-dioxygenase|nr:3-hydroxyanthranilate 3,4-dioxygenase [Actinomycetota bacterium]MDP7550363.1 3-hydroxyanthranilate 3,4-dioxygenase [Acidimicrobiales bacterium]MBT3687162.1 3-hydroxyanthranilate 3,4-dioxygenase [Actinomycetota bacterium]MBT4038030.1 3-hydroxyanthranilate 3,4-dioxygenase [Actinomycetota bacterium]MBT4279492.1 3-hydroxyanthranilate 3,4-dioxygenase [Actinomycetota bacterium]|tara:strand:+ start:21479 stop:22015 length:537 start_codon:yes stop_codon:yes gene_type:complete